MAARLTAVGLSALVKAGKPGAKGDGGNLFIRVTAPGQGKWTFRFMIAGKAREAGLGAYSANGESGLSLAQAREAASEARRLLKAGIDPLEHKRTEAAKQAAVEADRQSAEAAVQYTFRTCAEDMIGAQEASWSNAKHRQQWMNTLATYAFPLIGAMPVASVEIEDVRKVLVPIWRTKPETAARVKMRVLAVLRHARAGGHRPNGSSPADIDEALRTLLPKSAALKRAAGYGHHAALPWQDVGAFMTALRGREGIAARALEFLILTAARTGEALGARWSEIDLEVRIWVVPAARMKARRPHRVPLSDSAMAVLNQMRGHAAGRNSPVFPGAAQGATLSAMAVLMVLRRMNPQVERGDGERHYRWHDRATDEAITAHGFRSCFRDWASEATSAPHAVMEAALAHAVSDKVERAYSRTDFLDLRRALMERWGDQCRGGPADVQDLAGVHAIEDRTLGALPASTPA